MSSQLSEKTTAQLEEEDHRLAKNKITMINFRNASRS